MLSNLRSISAVQLHRVVYSYPAVELGNHLFAFVDFYFFLLDCHVIGLCKVPKITILHQISKIHVHLGTRHILVWVLWYTMIVLNKLTTSVGEHQTCRYNSLFGARLATVFLIWFNWRSQFFKGLLIINQRSLKRIAQAWCDSRRFSQFQIYFLLIDWLTLTNYWPQFGEINLVLLRRLYDDRATIRVKGGYCPLDFRLCISW